MPLRRWYLLNSPYPLAFFGVEHSPHLKILLGHHHVCITPFILHDLKRSRNVHILGPKVHTLVLLNSHRMWADVANIVNPPISNPPEMVFTILRVYDGGMYSLFFFFDPILPFLILKETSSNVFASIIEQCQSLTVDNLSCNGRSHYETHKTLTCLRRSGFPTF